MLAALACARHRGPDATGPWGRAPVLLGFNRLPGTVADGSPQPLPRAPAPRRAVDSPPARYTIVLNGEVSTSPEVRAELAAGHAARFRPGGDTEAVVAAYHH